MASRPRAPAALLLLAACVGDHRFHTLARYEAPRGGCALALDARGIIRGGADHSAESAANVELRSRASGAVVVRAVLDHGRVDVEGGLETLWSRAGCAPAVEEEEELRSAIEGVLLGPKGTLMDGQTRFLKVLATRFER